jgi:hypothetical protein
MACFEGKFNARNNTWEFVISKDVEKVHQVLGCEEDGTPIALPPNGDQIAELTQFARDKVSELGMALEDRLQAPGGTNTGFDVHPRRRELPKEPRFPNFEKMSPGPWVY